MYVCMYVCMFVLIVYVQPPSSYYFLCMSVCLLQHPSYYSLCMSVRLLHPPSYYSLCLSSQLLSVYVCLSVTASLPLLTVLSVCYILSLLTVYVCFSVTASFPTTHCVCLFVCYSLPPTTHLCMSVCLLQPPSHYSICLFVASYYSLCMSVCLLHPTVHCVCLFVCYSLPSPTTEQPQPNKSLLSRFFSQRPQYRRESSIAHSLASQIKQAVSLDLDEGVLSEGVIQGTTDDPYIPSPQQAPRSARVTHTRVKTGSVEEDDSDSSTLSQSRVRKNSDPTPGGIIDSTVPKLLEHCRVDEHKAFMPFFLPGRVLHIQVRKSER